MGRWQLEQGVVDEMGFPGWLANDGDDAGVPRRVTDSAGVDGESGDVGGVGGLNRVAASGSSGVTGSFEFPDGGGVSGSYLSAGVVSGVKGYNSWDPLTALTGVGGGVEGTAFAFLRKPGPGKAGCDTSLPMIRQDINADQRRFGDDSKTMGSLRF